MPGLQGWTGQAVPARPRKDRNACALGALMYRVAADRRRIAKRNLELCFPEKTAAERKRLLKENFASTGIAFFEMAMSWWWSRKRVLPSDHAASKSSRTLHI